MHFDEIDAAGHKSDFGSPEYLEAIATVDGYIGQVIQSIDNNEEWLTVVTTDHGGDGDTHGQPYPDEETVFLILSGPSSVVKETVHDKNVTQVDIVLFQPLIVRVFLTFK